MRRAVALAAFLICLPTAAARAQAQDGERSTSWLQRRLESGLASSLGGTVRIGRMDVDWSSLSATIGDVAISIPAENAPPLTATLTEGSVKLAWSGLTGIAAGDIHITEIVARGASFSLSREWIENWKPAVEKKSGGDVAIQIDRLILENGTAEYLDVHNQVRIGTTAMEFRGDWSTSRRLLVGEVHADATVEAPLFGRAWPATVRGGLRLGGGRLEIFNATGEGTGATAEMTGNVTWGSGASFTAEGRLNADLKALSPYLAGALPLSGTAEGPVQIVFTGGVPIRVTMQADTTGLRIGPVVTESAHADVTVRPGHLDVDHVDARGYGGAFTGSVGLTFGHPVILKTDLTGKGADLARLIALAGKDVPIASTADVTFAIEGEAGRAASWTGGATFDAVPAATPAPGRTPARGRGRVTFSPGRVRVDAESLSLAGASLRFGMDAELSGTATAVQIEALGTTRDARATQLATLAFLDAFGVPRNRFAAEPVEGAGSFAASVKTAAQRTAFDLSLDLANGSYAGEPFQTATLDLGSNASSLAIRKLDLSGDGTSLSGRARFDAGTGDLDDVVVKARGVGIARLLAKLGAGAYADGRADLDFSGSREAGAFAGQGTVTARSVIVGHEIVDTIEAPIRVEGELVVLDGLEARGHGFWAKTRVLYDFTKEAADVEVLSSRVDLGSNRTLAEAGLTADGHIAAQGSLMITKDGPVGLLSVYADELLLDTGRSGLREIRLGDLGGTAAISPLGLELTVRSLPNTAWTFDAFLGFAKELPLSAVLYFQDLVAGAGGAFGESIDLRLKGQVQAEGDLTEPRAMEVNGSFDEIAVRLGSRVLRAEAPFPVRLESGRFLLGPSRFTGDSGAVELALNGSLEGGDVAGYLRGTLDLAIVSSLWSEIRGSGPIDVDATLGGTLSQPDLQGRVAVHDGRLRVVGHPQSLESINAEAQFSGQTLTLVSFHAFQGGGEVGATGHVDFAGITPASFHAVFDGANVTATFPLGFKGTYEGRLVVDGTPKHTTISGRVDVVRGLYAKNFEIGLFGGARREFEGDSESPLPRNIALDIDVVAPGNLILRNDIAKLEASGQLHIGGELARPEVTGRLAVVPGGTVRYREVDYIIDSASLELTDPKRINPYMDLRARTRVGVYEIGLHVEGTTDKFDYELVSTPPLASQDIVSLLVTGKTMDELSGSATAGAIPGDMAAYYFAGLLNATFGKQIQNSLGIDQLDITPLLLKGQSDPTARVTVGKQVSDTVKILFSQDIGSAQKQTYQVSWDATRRVRLVAESDTEAGVGGEVQFSQQFGGTPPALREVVAPGAPGGGDVSGIVASVQIQSDDGADLGKLVKKVPLHVGQAFDRGRMLQGGDRIRAALVKRGFIQANVKPEAAQVADNAQQVAVLYRVAPGPRVNVQIVMTGGSRGKRGMKKAFKTFSKETPYTPDFWDEATHALVDELQQEGYYTAEVSFSAADVASGRTVRITVERGKPVRLRAVRFSGVSELPLERVEKQVTSLRKSAFTKRLLRPGTLAADLASVRALYREEGYTRVRIGEPQIALATTADAAEVDVAIQEGPRFTVRIVEFSETNAATESMLQAWTPMEEGDTFSARRLAEAEQALKDHLDALGYPDVTVESKVAFSTDTVDVAFDIDAGAMKTVGAIEIAGNRVTTDRTIAKALTFGRGDLLSRHSVLNSQQQLYRMGLFSSVRINAAPLGDVGSPAQQVTVKVDEAPPFSLGLGAGYDSNDGPRASVLLGYSNLGGRNIAITFQGRVSSQQNQEVLTVRRRRVFGNTIDCLGSLLFEKTVETGFTQLRRSASIRLEQRPRPRWIRFLRYTIQQVHINDITDSQAALEAVFQDKLSELRLADIGLGFVRDTRDDAFLPTRGGYGSIEGSIFARPLGSEATLAKLFLRGAWTITFKNATRFATFLRIGAAYPFANTDVVPLSERFFAGGSSTMRGFATDSVGGLIVGGFNTGGQSLLILNEEYQFPIWRSLHGELFMDVGNVYPTISDFDPTDLRSSAGVGLRLDTPIGPIRIEYGWKLDRREGESGGEVVFAIGAVF